MMTSPLPDRTPVSKCVLGGPTPEPPPPLPDSADTSEPFRSAVPPPPPPPNQPPPPPPPPPIATAVGETDVSTVPPPPPPEPNAPFVPDGVPAEPRIVVH